MKHPISTLREFFVRLNENGTRASLLGTLEEYDYAKYGPLLGVSDEGSAAETIASAAYLSAKAKAGDQVDPKSVGVIVDGERMTSAGEVPIGPDEYELITRVTNGRTFCSTNVGVRVSARLYQPLPEFKSNDAKNDEEAWLKKIFDTFKPFVDTPDRRSRPLTVRITWQPFITDERHLRKMIKAIEGGRRDGRLGSTEVHRISLLVDFGGVINRPEQIEEIKKLIKFASECRISQVVIDGELVAAARPRLSVQGLLNVLSPDDANELLDCGSKHQVDVIYRYDVDPETAARIVWTGLQTARAQGLNGAKYGLTPLTLSEQQRVVSLVQNWTQGWTAIPAFYIDTPLYTNESVFLSDRCDEALRLWLDMVAKAGAKIVLVDSPDRITPRIDAPSRVSPRRLVRDDGGVQDRGVLSLAQIKTLIRRSNELDLKILWSGGISAKDAFALANAGAFGIFTTSSTAKRIAVGPVLANDLQLAAEFEPTELGVRRIHSLLQAGFLAKKAERSDPQVAGEIQKLATVVQSTDVSDQDLLIGIEKLDDSLKREWRKHWNETKLMSTTKAASVPPSPKNKLEANLNDISIESQSTPLDCIVVGAGSAGLTTVRTLIERNAGLRVLLLEAGPAPFFTHLSNTDLRYSRELSGNLRDQVLYSHKLPDGKPFGSNYGCFGGRGLFWNGAAPRFRAHDFEGWPISEKDLSEVYKWAENEFRVTNSLGTSPLANRIIAKLKAADLAAEAGPFAVDLKGEGAGELGAGVASGLGLFFRRCSQALTNQAGELRVAVNSYVERVVHDGKEVKGVVVIGADGSPVQIKCRTVVLAAGGIESVRLAANSNIPDDNRRIGVGIQEHLFYDCWFSAQELYDNASPDTAVVYVPSKSQDSEQWEFHAPGRRLFSLDDGSKWEPSDQQPYWIMCRAFCATEKSDSNKVEALSGKRGEAVVHFAHSEKDNQNKSRILNVSKQIKEALGAKEADGKPAESPDRFRPYGASYHEAGGLDMGRDRSKSVTDPEGRFHTLPNLICVDAAAFPRIGATNPHLTIVALARQKAMSLADRLQAGTELRIEPEPKFPVGPQAIRVFCGYRLSALSRQDFFKELGQTFMPGTPLMQAPLGLSAYLPAVTDVEPGGILPEELALIVYSSLDDYNRTRNTSLSRRMYTRSHWAVFDMAKSRAQFPGPVVKPIDFSQNNIMSRAWYMFETPIDWQFGKTRVVLMQRNRSDVSLANSVHVATRDAAQGLVIAGFDQLIGYATEEFAALWLHSPTDVTDVKLADLKIVPAEATLIRELTAKSAFVRGDDEPGVAIDGEVAFSFRFERSSKYFPNAHP